MRALRPDRGTKYGSKCNSWQVSGTRGRKMSRSQLRLSRVSWSEMRDQMGRESKSLLQKPGRSLYIVYNRTLKTTGTTKENIGTPNGQSQEGIVKYTMTKHSNVGKCHAKTCPTTIRGKHDSRRGLGDGREITEGTNRWLQHMSSNCQPINIL